MTRAELEKLDRDGLVARAQAAGVTRPSILTRPELVDELLLRSTPDPASLKRARGFFGVARDLLASVVELGLNLPDAADRIRTIGAPPARPPGAAAALPTVTLAEIYAAQGHRNRAVETLEDVLAREPDHAAARSLVAQLRDGRRPVPPPRMPPESDDEAAAAADAPPEPPPVSSSPPVEEQAPPAEPSHMLDDQPLPPRYDVNECVVAAVDPRTIYVYWEIRESTRASLQAASPDGRLVLRLVVIEPTWDGPRSSLRDHDVDVSVGDLFARDLPAGCIVRAAIGWRTGAAFESVAHAPALEVPAGAPSPFATDVLVRWSTRGAERLSATDPAAAPLADALGLDGQREVLGRLEALKDARFLGSSDRWVRPTSYPPAAQARERVSPSSH